jgi:hypothetical protein
MPSNSSDIDSDAHNQLQKMIDDFLVQLESYRSDQAFILDSYRTHVEYKKINTIRHDIKS